jgi:putative ABC transport system ATP-binding protein
MSTPLVKISALCKTFVMGAGEVHALSGIDLEIAANSFTVVMGPSDRAKARSCIYWGLDRPTAGIKLRGKTDE